MPNALYHGDNLGSYASTAELFAGKQPQLPWRDLAAFRKAAREDANASKQTRMQL